MDKLKIFEIDTAHVDSYIHDGSTTMKFVEVNELRNTIKERIMKLRHKRKTDAVMELVDLLNQLDEKIQINLVKPKTKRVYEFNPVLRKKIDKLNKVKK